MYRYRLILCVLLLLHIAPRAKAQDTPVVKNDTFFLAKKKGLLGRLGRSVAINDAPPLSAIIKIDEPFIQYNKKIIRCIFITRLGFERNFYDTSRVRQSIGIVVANALHRNTKERVINKNLFFKEGDPLVPYLLADNERHLRELPFIQDARFQVVPAENSKDSVDVVVITKDVFSLGGRASISSNKRGELRLYDENMYGSGNEFSLSGLLDLDRSPRTGFAAEYIRRNVAGTFINWTTGFKTFTPAFNSGRREETTIYTRFDKPLVSPYFGLTGSLELAYRKTQNAYLADTVYKRDFKYEYYNADGWIGYNLGAKRLLLKNTGSRLRKFIGLRLFHNQFFQLPGRYATIFNYQYANLTGVLAAFTVFKQVFYKTRFVYGFGRSEDVPEGYTGSVIGGWTNKQGRSRPYLGFDLQRNYFKSSGFYSSINLRAGGYFYQKKAEDIDLFLNVDHFSRLKHLGGKWYHRWFLGGNLSKQIRPVLSIPLFLNSEFALPQFRNSELAADFRTVLRCESVFYNTWKFFGFRFAPFVFGDGAFLVPVNNSLSQGDFFSNLGAGVRTRNESLIFETMELRGFIFPRRIGDMQGWRIEFNTNIRFKYNSTFIRRPDFVNVN
jgi:hypothetical protein